jgi:hypothetical protein
MINIYEPVGAIDRLSESDDVRSVIYPDPPNGRILTMRIKVQEASKSTFPYWHSTGGVLKRQLRSA